MQLTRIGGIDEEKQKDTLVCHRCIYNQKKRNNASYANTLSFPYLQTVLQDNA